MNQQPRLTVVHVMACRKRFEAHYLLPGRTLCNTRQGEFWAQELAGFSPTLLFDAMEDWTATHLELPSLAQISDHMSRLQSQRQPMLHTFPLYRGPDGMHDADILAFLDVLEHHWYTPYMPPHDATSLPPWKRCLQFMSIDVARKALKQWVRNSNAIPTPAPFALHVHSWVTSRTILDLPKVNYP